MQLCGAIIPLLDSLETMGRWLVCWMETGRLRSRTSTGNKI